jgi:polysaccharide export outer membrane protein
MRGVILGQWTVAGLVALGAAGCGTAFDIPDDARPVAELPGRPQGSAALGPGDVLDVVYFGREELSGEFPIDEAGEIQYPLAGKVPVEGLTGDEAAALLKERMTPFFNNPELSVIPLIRVNVLGAVVQPGIYPLNPTYNIFDAIGSAGGPSREADFEEILLVRGGDYYVIDTRETLQLGRSLSQIGIQSGDIIVVPERSRGLENAARLGSIISALGILANAVLIIVTR